jgi:hypothetical protein
VDRDTLFNLARSVSDGDLALQLALVKLQRQMGYPEPVPDELIAAAGQALATLREACTKLEVFLFTLDRTP